MLERIFGWRSSTQEEERERRLNQQKEKEKRDIERRLHLLQSEIDVLRRSYGK